MLWDASQAYGNIFRPNRDFLLTLSHVSGNGRFDLAIKNAMGSGSGGTTIITTPTTTKTTTSTTSTGGGGGGCGGAPAWVSNIAVRVSSRSTLVFLPEAMNPLVCRWFTSYL